jgi:hypothetical protein
LLTAPASFSSKPTSLLYTSQTINGKYEMGLHLLLERKPNEYIVIKNYIDNLE